MTHALVRRFCASTAICAVLALGTTSVSAQDIAAPQPTIVLPNEAPAPAAPTAAPAMVSQPVVQQAPAPAAPPAAAAPEQAAPARETARRPAARTVAPTTQRAAAPAARSAASPNAAPVAPAVQPPAASVPLPQPPVAAAPATAQERPDTASGTDLPLFAGGAAALLIALGLGASVMRRGRRREDGEAPPAPMPAIEPTPHPMAAQHLGTEELAPAASLAHSALLAGPVPQTRAERDALLERMVAAPPDANNPFTSRKARMRRARIILQSREHEPTQPFDWRTYKPSPSDPAPATPPRVTA